jgi:hypothetical protein
MTISVILSNLWLTANCLQYINQQIDLMKYRVSIKSFPDYKHLLQENYVE